MTLHHEARQRWGKRCPCCDIVMRRYSLRPGRVEPRDMMTRGHDVAVALGGNPDAWVYICVRCNNEQGSRSFEQWAWRLGRAGDARELRVRALAVFVHQWCERAPAGRAAPLWADYKRATG